MFIREVRTLRRSLDVRRVRNEVRRFLTHDRSRVGFWRQVWWYYRTYLPKFRDGKMTLYLVEESGFGVPMGYGLLRDNGGMWWVTGALLSWARGFGNGEALFRFLTDEAVIRGGRVYLDVLESNVVARNLYEKIGYNVLGERGGVVVMKYEQ